MDGRVGTRASGRLATGERRGPGADAQVPLPPRSAPLDPARLTPRLRASALAALALTAAACAGPFDDAPTPPTALTNSAGKADAIRVPAALSAASPSHEATLRCDDAGGCSGTLHVELVSPEPCTLLGEGHCDGEPTTPLSVPVATLTVTSSTEGARVLPLAVETGDGEHIASSVAAAFTAVAGETVTLSLQKADTAPDVEVLLAAEWGPLGDTLDEITALRAFLDGILGLRYQETATQYPGYRAFVAEFEQPVSHAARDPRKFPQLFTLHHRARTAPTVLYTTGYALFSPDYVGEVAEALGANQVSTEQRYFGTSLPAGAVYADWQHVNIAEAAADHHRLIEALKPFYAGKWLSTGHSKGGMTSVFHRYFYPDDVDATLAYVTPISYAVEDPRFIPFLDQIGDAGCRERVRDVARQLAENATWLQPELEQQARAWGMTFDRVGGHARQSENSLLMLEWGFWQAYGVDGCAQIPTQRLAENDLRAWAYYYMQAGWHDAGLDGPIETYTYQAESQLGRQGLARAYLEPWLRFPHAPQSYLPAAVRVTHDPRTMQQVQAWVRAGAERLAFLYGEYDPWSGGAYDITGAKPTVLKVFAPQAHHTAALADLAETDRAAVLDAIEAWVGTRPTIGPGFTPSFAPHPPQLRRDGDTRGLPIPWDFKGLQIELPTGAAPRP